LLTFNIPVACGGSSVKFEISQFGASGDGNPVNTIYVQKAIDECSKNGGRLVIVPGAKFISGANFVKRDSIFR
jgi:polygalacturonase